MTNSIRRRVIWSLMCLCNEVSKRCMQNLSGHDIKTQSCRDFNDWSVVSIGMNRAHGQVSNTIADPALRDEIDKHGAGICVTNLNPHIADGYGLSASYNNLIIRHQKPPVGKIYDVSTVNRRMAGVES